MYIIVPEVVHLHSFSCCFGKEVKDGCKFYSYTCSCSCISSFRRAAMWLRRKPLTACNMQMAPVLVRPHCPSVILLLLIIIIIKIYETHAQLERGIFPWNWNNKVGGSIRTTHLLSEWINKHRNRWCISRECSSVFGQKFVQNCLTIENPWSLSTVLEKRGCMMFCFKIYGFGSTKQSEPTSVTTQIVLFVNWGDYWGVSVGQWGNLMEWALFKHPPRHLWLALGLAVGHCWRNSSGQIACMGKRMTSNNISLEMLFILTLDMSFCGRHGQQVG